MTLVQPTYDAQNAPFLTLTPSQKGYAPLSSGVWQESNFPFEINTTTEVGFSFDFGVDNEASRGLALAPRRPFTNYTTDPLGIGETSKLWTLTLSTTATSIPATIFFLYGTLGYPVEAWSGSTNTPNLNRTTLNESFFVVGVSPDSTNWVLNGSTYDVVFNLNFASDFTESTTGATVSQPFNQLVNHPEWTGLLQFIVDPTLGASFTFSAATFAGYTVRAHTGMVGAPNRRARVVHDYITGLPYMSDEAVSDGFREGIMVHPDSFDPADPLDTDYFVPRPSEGLVEDEIPDAG